MPFYYVADLVGDGSERDPWRAPGAAPVSGIIDLRGDSTLGGDAIAYFSEPQVDPDRLFPLADLVGDQVFDKTKNRLETRLGLTLSETRLDLLVAELLLQHSTRIGDKTRWNPLRDSWTSNIRPLPEGSQERSFRVAVGDQLVFRSGTTRLADHHTVIINDTFATLGSGSDIHGRTPAPTNTPGNTWVGSPTTGGLQGDGSGGVFANANGDQARIDTGVTDLSAAIDYNSNGEANRFSIFALCPNIAYNSAGFDAYLYNPRPDANSDFLYKIVNTSFTQLATGTPTLGGGVFNYKIEVQAGASQQCYLDGSPTLSATDTALDGSTVGGSYALFEQALLASTNMTFDNFVVDDLSAAGLPPAQIDAGHGALGGIQINGGMIR